MRVTTMLLCAPLVAPLQLWADLRCVQAHDLPDALAKCESAIGGMPVDAALVMEQQPAAPLPSVCKTYIYCKPMAAGGTTSALRLTSTGQQIGIRADASEPDGQKAAMAAVGSTEWIHLDAHSESDWTMIPAENVISVCDGTPTRVAATAFSAEQIPGLAFALQLGVDALVLVPPGEGGDYSPAASSSSSTALWEAAAIARAQRAEDEEQRRGGDAPVGDHHRTDADGVDLTTGVVTAVEAGGVGDRVALDFTSLLRMGEGALVGSSAKLLGLVHGETIKGELVPARPFRVNAGPVHSYVLLADGRTKYLEEVRAGDEILIVDAHGSARALTVGRCKLEPRPLLMVSFEVDGAQGQMFLQQAETVRVLVEDEHDLHLDVRSVTDLKVGERLRVRQTHKGTHVGRAISARVDEM
jgi:3-dehydroquinate synthase II